MMGGMGNFDEVLVPLFTVDGIDISVTSDGKVVYGECAGLGREPFDPYASREEIVAHFTEMSEPSEFVMPASYIPFTAPDGFRLFCVSPGAVVTAVEPLGVRTSFNGEWKPWMVTLLARDGLSAPKQFPLDAMVAMEEGEVEEMRELYSRARSAKRRLDDLVDDATFTTSMVSPYYLSAVRKKDKMTFVFPFLAGVNDDGLFTASSTDFTVVASSVGGLLKMFVARGMEYAGLQQWDGRPSFLEVWEHDTASSLRREFDENHNQALAMHNCGLDRVRVALQAAVESATE